LRRVVFICQSSLRARLDFERVGLCTMGGSDQSGTRSKTACIRSAGD
jgi:hypothetical protein